MNDLIEINCYITNSLDKYKFYIYIYDKNCNLIEKYITNNGRCYVKLNDYGIYKIIAVPLSYKLKNVLKTNYFYSENGSKNINLFFTKKNIVTMRIIDKFYDLKLEKGEIKLWMVITQ